MADDFLAELFKESEQQSMNFQPQIPLQTFNMNHLNSMIMAAPPQKQHILISLVQQRQAQIITEQQFNDRFNEVLDPNFVPQQINKRPFPEPSTSLPIQQMMPQQVQAAKRVRMEPTQVPTHVLAQVPTQVPAQVPAQKTIQVNKKSAPSGKSGPNTPQQSEPELDLGQMMDVTNYAGVDLREEEYVLSDVYRRNISQEQRFNDDPFLNLEKLRLKVLEIVKGRGIQQVDPTFTNFLSQAADAYVNRLLVEMCKISDHRATVDYDVLLGAENTGNSSQYELDIIPEDDVKLSLIEIERRERDEQEFLIETIGPGPTEEEEQEGEQPSISVVSSGGNAVSTQSIVSKVSDKSIDTKKSKKLNIKKDLPEAVKNKITNNAALMAAGGTVKSWMLPGATIAAPTPKLIPKDVKGRQNISKAGTVRTGSRLRTQKRITIKDALFVMEQQRELKHSEIVYKWWANVK